MTFSTSFNAYVIEVLDATVGIVVRDGDRFRFCASDRQFYGLEGRSFCNPRAAETAALRHIQDRKPERPSTQRAR